jgi:hypothetical protein
LSAATGARRQPGAQATLPNQDVNLPSKWEADYEGKTDGWDLGGPTPIFKRLMAGDEFKPGRLIVPGAGRGHDAREFARHGFEVTAVDFSAHAVGEMRRLASPDAPVEILQSDLFKLPAGLDASFDYVLEYTCFCAIDPKRRGECRPDRPPAEARRPVHRPGLPPGFPDGRAAVRRFGRGDAGTIHRAGIQAGAARNTEKLDASTPRARGTAHL